MLYFFAALWNAPKTDDCYLLYNLKSLWGLFVLLFVRVCRKHKYSTVSIVTLHTYHTGDAICNSCYTYIFNYFILLLYLALSLKWTNHVRWKPHFLTFLKEIWLSLAASVKNRGQNHQVSMVWGHDSNLLSLVSAIMWEFRSYFCVLRVINCNLTQH